MRVEITQRFPAPLEAVEAALGDPAFLARLGDLPKLGRPELLDEQREGRRVRRRVRYHFTGDLSPAVRRFVDPARLSWVEESTTDLDAHRSELVMVPDHYRHLLTFRATAVLAPAGDGTLRTTVGDLHVRLPVVGRQAERAVASGLAEHAEGEVEVFRAWWQPAAD